MLPDTCPTCHVPKSHDTATVGPLQGRVYLCGSGVCTTHAGQIVQAIVCPNALTIIADLRAALKGAEAQNVRLGDQCALLTVEALAAVGALEHALRGAAIVPLDRLPSVMLLDVRMIRAAYDVLVEALEGAAPTAS